MNAILFAAVLFGLFRFYSVYFGGNNVRSPARLPLKSQLFMHTMSPLVLISLDMLNERIRALRLAKGLTLQQVGDVFGISRASVSNWEAGHAQPDPRKIERLAQLFDTSVQFLLSGKHTLAPIDLVSTFRGIPFVSFTNIKNTFDSIETLRLQSDLFVPMSFDSLSDKAFCTDFPTAIAYSSGRLIPPGAVVFFDPQLALKNHAVVLFRDAESNADFCVADISSNAIKLCSITQREAQPFKPGSATEILGIAAGYVISVNL